jgi:aspartyl-tRNA(Asn)/glutamyl-tRNA(Gln) amidotransferase subunit C
MIDREQVLHVARLARLELSEPEVERMSAELSRVLEHIERIGELDLDGVRMSAELSRVLEHIERIGELDLDGVPPTSHVVEVSGALRADVPRPCLPREIALANAPAVASDGFEVPSPTAESG